MLNEPGARGRVGPADIHEELLGEGENVPLGRREQRRTRVVGERKDLGLGHDGHIRVRGPHPQRRGVSDELRRSHAD